MNTCRKHRKGHVFSYFGQQYSEHIVQHLSDDMRKVYIPFIFPYLVQQVNWEVTQVTGRKVIKSDLTIAYQTIFVI